MRFYGRAYRLEIGDDAETLVLDGTGTNPAAIEFRVDVGTSQYLSIAQIVIHGLSRETQEKAYNRYTKVVLAAGWLERMGTIFDGYIFNVSIGRNGPDSYITLYCRSVGSQESTAALNKPYGAGTPVVQIIRDAAELLGKPVSFYGPTDGFPVLMRDRTVSQSCVTLLKTYGDIYGFRYITGNTETGIYIDNVQDDGTVGTDHFTSADTDMIGTPRVLARGIDVDIQLNSDLKIFDHIVVENVTAELNFLYVTGVQYRDTIGRGRYRIQNITHQGSLSGEWKTTVEGLAPRYAELGPRQG